MPISSRTEYDTPLTRTSELPRKADAVGGAAPADGPAADAAGVVAAAYACAFVAAVMEGVCAAGGACMLGRGFVAERGVWGTAFWRELWTVGVCAAAMAAG